MKRSYFGIVLALLIVSLPMFEVGMTRIKSGAQVQSGPTYVSGIITENTTWTLNSSPYIVTADVAVDINVLLTIEPGVTVKFTNGTNLIVDGCLIAQGNSTNRITFTSNSTNPASGDWGTINIRHYSGGGNIFEYAHVDYASTALTLAADCNITASTFEYNGNGISLANPGNVVVGDTQATNNIGYGISGSISQNATIENCEISMNGAGASITGLGILVENATVERNNGLGMSLSGWAYVNNSSFLANGGGGLSYAGNYLELVDTNLSNNMGSGLSESGGKPNTNVYVQSSTFLNDTNGVSMSSGDLHYGGGVAICDMYDCALERNSANGITCSGASQLSVNCSRIRSNLNGVQLIGYEYSGPTVDLNNSEVANNENGLVLTGGLIPTSSANVYNSAIRNNSNCGVFLNGWLSLDNGIIEQSTYGVGGTTFGARLTASLSIIADNSIGVSAYSFDASFTTVANNTVANIQGQSCTLLGCNVYNTTTNVNCPSCTLENCNVSDASTNIQCDSGTLDYCNVYNSTTNIQCTSSGTLQFCNIYNGTLGVKLGSGAINYCNIFNNTGYNVQDTSSSDINATYNWWGTTNETLIKQYIYDYYDDPANLGRVFYNPFMTTPVTTEVDTVPPVISSISTTPSMPNYDESVVVSATMIDNVAVDQALLSYTSGMNWYNVSMSRFGDGFNATIPAQPWNTTVQYRIYANDTSGNWAESGTYSYVVQDFVPPSIVAVNWKPTNPLPYVPSNVTRTNEPTLITANVTEPINASGTLAVLFYYRVDAGDWWNTTMTYNATAQLWMQTIPGQPNNTNTVEFFIQAYDNAGNLNTSSVQSYQIKHLRLGDVNGDGKIDITDVATVAKHFGEHSP